MKKTIAVILSVIMALGILSGCGAAPEQSPSGSSAGIPNPVTEMSSVEEINDAVGCCIDTFEQWYLYEYISDESFSVINGEPAIAQYRFKLAEIPVTVRAAVSKEDISGIYMADGKMPHENLDADRIYDPVDTGYGLWNRWFVGGMQYSLTVGDGKDYSMALSKMDYYGNLLDLFTDIRDCEAMIFPWYQYPYYTYEYDDYIDWEDPAVWVDVSSFTSVSEARSELAELNESFEGSFGTGDAIPYAELRNYKAAAHKNTVKVSNIDELLEAIAPDTEIILESGDYVISNAVNYGTDGKYYRWEESYDGYELVINSVDDLSLTGAFLDNGSEIVLNTELHTDPRYSYVLNFRDCDDLELAGLVIGHTDGLEGYCTGGVLYIEKCSGVKLTGCELYGCGTYGITGQESDSITVTDSVVRCCTYGHTTFNFCNGVSFDRCSFMYTEGYTGNAIYGCQRIAFNDCDFANNNLNEMFSIVESDDVKLANCLVANNTLYNGIFAGDLVGLEVEGGACVEPGSEPGIWTEIAAG